jgi:hypothetical protein
MPAIAPINVSHETFIGFLQQNEMEIPDLQRPFSWGNEQVEDLISDLLNIIEYLRAHPAADEKAQHFFGTVVYLKKPGIARISIIDGQQRITAITVLLGVLRGEFESLKEELKLISTEDSKKLVERISDHASQIKVSIKTLEDANGKVRERLEPSPEIRKTYSAILNGTSIDIASEQDLPATRLREAVKKFQEELIQHPDYYKAAVEEDRLNHLVLVKQAILECLIFVTVETGSANAVYDLFESLNAKGEPLNAIDLLKVWVMASMQNNPKSKQVSEQFRRVATPQNLYADPVYFLRTYFAARLPGRTLNSQLNPKNTSLMVRRMLFGDPLYNPGSSAIIEAKIVDEIETMEKWLPTFIDLTAKPPKYPLPSNTAFHSDRYQALLTDPLKHLTALPLLLSSAQYLSSDDYFQLIHLVEKCFFRLKMICGARETHLAAAYNNIIELQQNGTYSNDSAKQILKLMLDDHAPEAKFREKLAEVLIYRPGIGAKRIKYFLWMLELYSGNPAPAPKHYDLDKLTVEHIHAQANEKYALDSEDDLHRLGNMCLLTSTENPSLNNKTFEEKKKTVEGWIGNGKSLECNLSREVFTKFANWDSKSIEKHETDVINFAVTKVFKV